MGSVFLSHSSKDKDFVRKLAADLRRNGHYAWVDEAEIKLGDSLIEKIEEGIENTDYLGVILSSHSIASKWVTREVRIALTQEIYGKRLKVFPILLEKVKIPAFLLDKKYADFTSEENYKNSLQLIVERLATPPDDIEKSSFSTSEVKFYMDQLEQLKSELNTTRGEKRLLLERLEKERKNIPDKVKDDIRHENEIYPEFSDINRLYAFTTNFGMTITAGYLLHGLRKEHIKGGPHQIAMVCQLDNKTDELALLMEATLTRIAKLKNTGEDVLPL